jgi:hypothetical protein
MVWGAKTGGKPSRKTMLEVGSRLLASGGTGERSWECGYNQAAMMGHLFPKD